VAAVNSIPVSSATLAEWSRRAAGGDAAAVEQLLWAHRGRLFGYAKRKIGPDWKERIDPDDLLQESYISIVDGITSFTFRDDDSFYAWATRIIDHRFIDMVRRARRRKRDAFREVSGGATGSRHDSFLSNKLADSDTPSRAMRRDEAIAALMTGIACLPPAYRFVVQQYCLAGQPLAAVARSLGRSEDAVRRMASRAVAQLREKLKDASRFFSRFS
jgi:RNA polymerase sigma factor (sigma-70 family)